MTKTKHTPLPWYLNKATGHGIYGAGARYVGQVWRSDDAAFIVRACNEFDMLISMLNAHHDLVKALRAAEQWAMTTQTDCVPWLDAATAALVNPP